MNKLLTASLVSLFLIPSTAVLADRDDEDTHNYFEDTARVLHVEPRYRTVRVATPQRECVQRPVYRRSTRHPESYTSTIAGGIIGGVIGNQFGKGDGKTAMTVAGTLLGGSIGRDMKYQHERYDYDDTEYREVCHVRERYHEEDRIDGYRVTYQYRGQRYTTIMDHRPGKRIPVEVIVRPRTDDYSQHHYY